MSLTYPEAVQFLYSLRLFGTKLDLENTQWLAARAGNPHHRLRFIHVAGTNGKGSTCAMLESIYREAGYNVGMFTSPHLVSFRERIQVNRELIPEDEVVRLVRLVRDWTSSFPLGAHPTFFEVVTVMALRYFEEEGCDLVVWETGLGGRLDATNIVTPLASVITNIQFDHEKWLGTTLSQIAAEKSGIIKPGIPALTAAKEAEALKVIQSAAREKGAPLQIVTVSGVPLVTQVQLPLLGEHQLQNAALAVATVESLQTRVPVQDQFVRAGLENVRWLGRLQLETLSSGGRLLLDGAHNPAGAVVLRAALETRFSGSSITLILGVLHDKNWKAICQTLIPLAHRVLLAPVQSGRTALPSELAEACREIRSELEVVCCPTLRNALELAQRDRFVVVTGSLLFVGEAEQILGFIPCSTDELGLNEWDASRTTGGARHEKG